MLESGVYGGKDSTYRMEVDTLTRFTAKEVAGNGPQYFIVKTRDGLTMEYGGSSDSRAPTDGSTTVRVWELSKVSDSVGNTMIIKYGLPSVIAASTTENNIYPLSISYTSNAGRTLAATNSVEFSYVSRSDPIKVYQGGHFFKTSILLSAITTKVGASSIVTYVPSYEAANGGRSAITSISLCSGSGACLAGTKFGLSSVSGTSLLWSAPRLIPIAQATHQVGNSLLYSLELNGDGYVDLLAIGGSTYSAYMSRGDGTFETSTHSSPGHTDLSNLWRVLDIDGDGRADLVNPFPKVVFVWRSKGDGTFSETTVVDSVATDWNNDDWQVLDVNGDGLADLIHLRYDGEARVWKSRGDGTFDISTSVGSVGTGGAKALVLDVNGDGLADLVFPSRFPLLNKGVLIVWLSNGDGSFRTTGSSSPVDPDSLSNGRWNLLDVNGDGLVDLVHLTSDGHVRVWMSKGDGTFEVIVADNPADTALTDGTWQLADLEGDGLFDLVHLPSDMSSGVYWEWHSKGDGTFAVVKRTGDPIPKCASPCSNFWASGDFVGGGATNLVRNGPAGIEYLWLVATQPSNLVTSISDGLGGTVAWDISPLSSMLSRGSYVRDIPSDQNVWTLASAIPVVEAVRTNVGWVRDAASVNVDRVTRYSYGSARVERNGRGFVGFNWLQSRDSTTGLSMRTYFRQDFPFTGLAAMKGTGSGGGWNNLSLTSTSYGCTLLNGGSGCPIAAGNRYFVYPSQIDTQSWDLDGTALPRTRVVNASPDLYGNLGSTTTSILNADGSATDYSKTVTNTYYNDPTNWYIGRLVKSVATTNGPTIAAPVTPGSGGLPGAVAPTLPPQVLSALMTAIQLLLGDD